MKTPSEKPEPESTITKQNTDSTMLMVQACWGFETLQKQPSDGRSQQKQAWTQPKPADSNRGLQRASISIQRLPDTSRT
eukprot:6004550-Alexandrium_andersonii.AAC.1